MNVSFIESLIFFLLIIVEEVFLLANNSAFVKGRSEIGNYKMYFHILELLAFGFLAALELINGEGGTAIN